jgi:hypothetical protein
MTKRIGKRYKVTICGDDRKTVLSRVFPDPAIGCAAAEANACDVNGTGEKISDCLDQSVGKIFIKQELHPG